MKEEYKQRVYDHISSIEGRITLVEKMIEGSKRSDPREAKQYLSEAKTALSRLNDIVSIS